VGGHIDREKCGTPAEVLRRVRSTLSQKSAFSLSWAIKRSGDDIVERASLPGSDRLILVLPSQEAIATVVDHPLDRAEQRLLAAGGILAWTGEAAIREEGDTSRTSINVTGKGGMRRSTPTVPMLGTSAPTTEITGITAGVMLQSSARSLHLPVSSGAHLFSGLTSQDVASVRRDLGKAGLDPLTVRSWRPPRPAIPSSALPATAIGLALLTLGVVGAATWTSARDTRRLVALLVALGISPGAAKRVTLIEHAYLLLAAATLGLLLGAVPITITLASDPYYVLTVPRVEATALMGGMLAAWLLSIFVAVGRVNVTVNQLSAGV